ncbi:MAG TPA: glycosyltransferase, partial [Gaiellaceae bacterium]
DAGGPLDIVHDGKTGLVVAPDAPELAKACARLAANPAEAKALGEAGKLLAERVTWDSCIDALLS